MAGQLERSIPVTVARENHSQIVVCDVGFYTSRYSGRRGYLQFLVLDQWPTQSVDNLFFRMYTINYQSPIAGFGTGVENLELKSLSLNLHVYLDSTMK